MSDDNQVKIDDRTLTYWLVKYLIAKPFYDFFYKKIVIRGTSKIPYGQPVILAPNHQNALMDALAIVIGYLRPVIFLTRSDIFKGKLVKKILATFKMLPVYRQRDGRSSLLKNEEIFNVTVDVLRNKKNLLCIFPEGNHGDRRRLRPLVKGIFRIAFQSQEAYGTSPGVKIIPVGVDYSHYQKFRQTQLLQIGDPIEVSEYWEEYLENPASATNKLRDRLSDEMKKWMIHIETEEYYELYMGMKSIYNKQMCKQLQLNYPDLQHRFIAEKAIIAKLDACLVKVPSRIEELNTRYTEYTRLRDKLKLRDWVPAKNRYNLSFNVLAIILSIIAWPVVVIGLFNNWPHFFLPPSLTKGIKDPQFLSTARWGTGTVLAIIYFLILFALALVFIPLWWVKIIYIISIAETGKFALWYRNFVVKIWARIRYTIKLKRKDIDTINLKSSYDKLIEMTENILADN